MRSPGSSLPSTPVVGRFKHVINRMSVHDFDAAIEIESRCMPS
jgi:hypothetical protein